MTLSPLQSGYRSSNALNVNLDAIETALENTLSRDGTTPNQMEAVLDMNDNKITNLAAPTSGSDAARYEDVLTVAPGTNVGDFLSTPSSANLRAAVTDETGTGQLVFNTSPSLTTPVITGGTITGITDLAIADGGTGSSTASGARTALGVAIGTDVQAHSSNLDEYAAVNPTAAGLALLDDADAVAQRTTLGLGSIATQAASAVAITGGSVTGITDITVADGGTGASTAADARTNLAVVGTSALASSTGVSLVGGQLSAGSNLQTQTLAQYIGGGPLMPTMFAGTDQQQVTRAITEAGQTRDGGAGQLVQLARKEYDMTASFNIADRVSIAGVNKRGSVLKANAAHTGPYMATAINGTSSMFDNCIRDLTLNCNDVAGLGGVLSDAWQEGGGAKNILIQKFRTYGIYFQNGYGGAAVCKIEDFELFGSSAGSSPTAGIYVAQIKAEGAFVLSATNGTIAGDAAVPITRGIHMVNDSLNARSIHFENCTTGIYLDGNGTHVLENITGLSNVTNLVEIASTFTGSLEMKGCKRDGATNLIKDNRTGAAKMGYGIPGVITTDGDIKIEKVLPKAIHGIVASGVFNGTGTPAMTNGGNGVTSITDNGTGDYTLNLSNTFGDANDILLFASHNGAGGNVRCDAVGTSSCRIYTYDAAGAAADQNQIKFIVVQTQFT